MEGMEGYQCVAESLFICIEGKLRKTISIPLATNFGEIPAIVAFPARKLNSAPEG